MAKQRAQDFKDLVDQNFVSKHGYMEREQVRIEQEADLANLRSRVKEIEAALREAHSQRAALMAETKRMALDSISPMVNKKPLLWHKTYAKPIHVANSCN